MIHKNSIKSFHDLDRDSRRRSIIDVYAIWDRPMTDRQVLDIMRFQDMNQVRPRISELIDMGLLKECGKVRDEITNKTVRLVRVMRPEEHLQQELF